ncbi:MAG: hypothetical protein VYA74_01740 [Bacteroidota bacterium]|nr:hypothetical protein [Bacteroidota bacterium]MEC8098425.1 hypothetical protein [Bacteroidota bacterium]MEC8363891.1 hypothetical protein [Bacteroidota bacterium]
MNTRFNFFLFLVIILFIYSCGKDDSPSGTSVNGDVDYFFEVEFAGKIHKIQGNTSSVIPLNSSGFGNFEFANTCMAMTGDTWRINLGIQDKSSANYISGDNFSMVLSIKNSSVGSNMGDIIFDGFEDYFNSLNILDNALFWENGSEYTQANRRSISNIILTDLGTETKMNQLSECGLITERYYCFGNTVKGSYNGTLMFQHKDYLLNQANHVAVPIKIRFSVPRFN